MDSIKIQHWNKIILCQKSYYTPAMVSVLDSIDNAIFSAEKILKNDATSTVALLKIDDQLLVVKRLNTKNWLHFFRRLFQNSRARKNWDNASTLCKMGIKTFKPIAILEERYGPLKGRSYFICSYIEGIKALEFFTHETVHEDIQSIAEKITAMFNTLATAWISHRDLNLSNILLLDNQPWLIDLDSMKSHRWSWIAKRSAQRELNRFIRNCQETPEVPRTVISLFQSLFNKCNM